MKILQEKNEVCISLFRPSLRDLGCFYIDPAVNCRAIFNGSFGTGQRWQIAATIIYVPLD